MKTVPNVALELTDENFDDEVFDSGVPVLVEFWADWCYTCRMLTSVIDELAEQYGGKIKFGKLNVDENWQTAEAIEVSNVPTVVLFMNGREVQRIEGAQTKAAYRDALNQLINRDWVI